MQINPTTHSLFTSWKCCFSRQMLHVICSQSYSVLPVAAATEAASHTKNKTLCHIAPLSVEYDAEERLAYARRTPERQRQHGGLSRAAASIHTRNRITPIGLTLCLPRKGPPVIQRSLSASTPGKGPPVIKRSLSTCWQPGGARTTGWQPGGARTTSA